MEEGKFLTSNFQPLFRVICMPGMVLNTFFYFFLKRVKYNPAFSTSNIRSQTFVPMPANDADFTVITLPEIDFMKDYQNTRLEGTKIYKMTVLDES